ncbi:hypothetical protein A5816_000563 [Enterococcus sp. 3G1_DIV0629]|uniref:hypothetical protein n=1 Tax=Enterococcus sp. (strain 3G1_DIV0629) TaxID=1834176 RepID=UPI000A35295B|nr:hypothetical protein [Enterococcus sp. 3G1_DIV0629]OTO28297.1 hypothetical protein A5816_000563 [Enterococcus sp. 3G1_DIV0629]
MKPRQKVRLTKSVLNGYKQWHKGEVVTINYFTTLAGEEFARVTDFAGNVLVQPIEWLEEIADDTTINELAFSIMHTEDLCEIHDLANKIYLESLHNDLSIKDNCLI